MVNFRDTGDRPETGGLGGADDLPPLPVYDPLLTPWEDPAGIARLAGPEDVLYASAAWAAELPQEEDFPGWSLPAGPRGSSPESGLWPQATAWQGSFYPLPLPQPPPAATPRETLPGTITVPRPERRWEVSVREVVETLLLAALIFLAVRASFQNFRVEGASMMPSLEDGEYLIVNKLTYAEIDLSMFDFLPFFDAGDSPKRHLWDAPSRGDVIVFRSPTSPKRDFIKRIIGTPGDTVQIEQASGHVSVNGAVLTEPYVQGATTCTQPCSWDIPPAGTAESRSRCGSQACYFVMGDNRNNSSDSRQGWLVPEENIVGKALITYWHQGGPEIGLAPNHSPAAGLPAGQAGEPAGD